MNHWKNEMSQLIWKLKLIVMKHVLKEKQLLKEFLKWYCESAALIYNHDPMLP